MKRIFYSLLLAFSLFACEEIPPDIGMDMGPNPEPPGIVLRKVIIEEFTGNRCINCPAGSELIKSLKGIHGDRLIPISLHCTDWAVPDADAQLDFRTQDAENIIQFLGLPAGFPAGIISRKRFDGGYGLQLGAESWPGNIDQELMIEAAAKVEITPGYDSATRTATVDVATEFIIPQTILGDDQTMLTVYLIEDHIIDFQVTPDGNVPDYDHRHVFRTALTPFSGEIISLDGQPGTVEETSYSMVIPNDWNADNVFVIAFVHNSGSNKEIYQAEEVHLVN